MKRFTETDKWKDPWFRKLAPDAKLLWLFICDQCDNAGVWDPDEGLFQFCSGARLPLVRGREALGDRVECLKNGKWLVRKFVDFQFGKLVDTNNCHRSVKALIAKHNTPAPPQGQAWGTPGALPGAQEKEKRKEEVQEKEKVQDREGGLGETKKATGVFQQKESFQIDTRVTWLSGWVNSFYGRPAGRTVSDAEEVSLLALVARRPDLKEEAEMIYQLRARLPDRSKFPRSVVTLLGSWQQKVDEARTYQNPSASNTDKNLDRILRSI